MGTILNNRNRFSQKFRFLFGFTIVLVWLQLGLEFFFQESKAEDSLKWMEIFKEFAFAIFITFSITYFFKFLKTHITSGEEEYMKLFRKNPYPMWVYDLQTLRFLLVNEAAVRLYGYSEEEFLTMTIKDIRPQDDIPVLITAIERVRLNFNLNYHWSGTWRHKKKNDQLIYVEVSSHEIIFGNKKAELVLSYDVTDKINQEVKLQRLKQDLEHKVTERTSDLLILNRKLIDQNKVIKSANHELYNISKELKEANEKIQEHADLKNKFVSMASHEFRTPLSTIKFAAGFIKKYWSKIDLEKILEKILSIDTQVSHMNCMLDDVLTLGKSDSGKMTVNIGQMHLHDFVRQIAQEVEQAYNNTHQIRLTIDENVPYRTESDEKLLRNIFINLLSNAIKYSPESDAVHFHISKEKDEIKFQVKDFGLGISIPEREKIFEPFYRITLANNISGTGLGLSIVKRAIGLINGRITLESEVGKGSLFTVYTPISGIPAELNSSMNDLETQINVLTNRLPRASNW